MSGTNQTIRGGGFHHVALKAKDFDASLKFYSQGLGFKMVLAWGEDDKRAVMLDTGDGSCLEIFAGGGGSYTSRSTRPTPTPPSKPPAAPAPT